MIAESFLFQILLLLVLAKALGRAFDLLSLPRVVGELLAGIILGPSLLNLITPREELEVLAILGVVFFMMSAGLEIDLGRFIKYWRQGFIIAVMGVVIPFTLGYCIGIAYGLDPIQCFSLGTALSITAIGLSVRVLMDLKMLRTRVGLAVINAAIDDDVIGLILMSVAFSLAIEGSVAFHVTAFSVLSSALFIGSGFLVTKYVCTHLRVRLFVDKYFRSPTSQLVLAISLAFLFGLLARVASLHEIIGVFIAGMLLRGLLSWKVEGEIFDFTFAFFALLFFSYIGIKTDLRVITQISDLILAVIVAAFVGKILGGFLGAKISRFTNGEALIVGIAMNSRAAVELAIASAFYSLGIFTLELFSAVVLMAAVTSITTPILLKLVAKYVTVT